MRKAGLDPAGSGRGQAESELEIRLPHAGLPLTGLDLTADHWKGIARNAPWQMTRMNLNTFARHDVFADKQLAGAIADRLRNADLVKKARVFPYQRMGAHTQAAAGVPGAVREALQDAMEVATHNVPSIDGQVYVCPDVSGSMSSPITGFRKGSTSAVRCIDALPDSPYKKSLLELAAFAARRSY